MKHRISSVAKTWNVNKPAQEKQTDTNEELHLAPILPMNYKLVDIAEVVQKQTHLASMEFEQQLHTIIVFQDFFQGKGREYNGEPITLDLLPGFKPFYAKPFSIPKGYQQTTKDEIARLESIGLFSKATSFEWAAPTFIIPKKNNTACVKTDFCGLNKCLKCNPCPMPKIPDIFKGLELFRYATMIDLNTGYYPMPLLEEAKKLCVISLPWGLYQYNMLPQGIIY
jgi:hypothetical protein